MTSKMLRNRILRGEDEATDFVRQSEPIDRVGRSVCAFLNSSGGTVIVGVRPDGSVVGVGPAAETQAFVLETKLQKVIAPSAMFTVTVDDVDGEAVILVEVPAGKDQPYVYGEDIFVREGARSKVANANDLRALVRRDREEPLRWERRLSPSMTAGDIDIDEVNQAIAQGVERVGIEPEDAKDPLEFLRLMSLSRAEGFTQGCDVLFAASPEQRHPQCRLQYVVFEKSETSDEYIDYRWFEGPLPRVALELSEKLATINAVRAKFVPESMARKSSSAYSLEALREAIVNALVHRDYTSYSGGVKVSVYPDRIEFWNSGQLAEELRVSDLTRVHPSIPTNPDIAHVFYLRGFMERVGRGTLKIIEASARLGARKPKWESRRSGVTLTIFAANTTTQHGMVSLNDRQQALLSYLDPGESIATADYGEQFAQDVSSRQARRDLSELEEQGYLMREGAGRSTRYMRLAE